MKDHPAELAFDGARGERCSDLVERGGGRRSREPVEPFHEASFDRNLEAPQQCVGVEPLEGDRPAFVHDRPREGRDTLTPRGLPLLGGGQSVQDRQAFKPFPSGSTHPLRF